MKLIPLLSLGLLALAVQAQDRPALSLKQTILLPQVKGRFDHFSIDEKGHRLFVAALGNNTLEVIDLNAGKRLFSVPAMSKPTGVLYLPESDRILVANGDDGTIKILNGRTLKIEQNLGGFEDADNLRFDAKTKLAWLGYGDGAFGVIDPTFAKLVARLKLPGHPESFQLEPSGTRLFFNIPDAKQVGVVDRDQRAVVATWPMERFRANFSMALDEAGHRLFVGCRSPARLVVLDTSTGNPVADLAISGDVDDLFFDSRRKRLYLSCGEGFIDIITQCGEDSYLLKERIPTRPGARTAFFSPRRGEFYVALPQRGQQSAELRVFAVQD